MNINKRHHHCNNFDVVIVPVMDYSVGGTPYTYSTSYYSVCLQSQICCNHLRTLLPSLFLSKPILAILKSYQGLKDTLLTSA